MKPTSTTTAQTDRPTAAAQPPGSARGLVGVAFTVLGIAVLLVVATVRGERYVLATTPQAAEVTVVEMVRAIRRSGNVMEYRHRVRLGESAIVTMASPREYVPGERLVVMASVGRITDRVFLDGPARIAPPHVTIPREARP